MNEHYDRIAKGLKQKEYLESLCEHKKPNGFTAFHGQKFPDGRVILVCAYCNKEKIYDNETIAIEDTLPWNIDKKIGGDISIKILKPKETEDWNKLWESQERWLKDNPALSAEEVKHILQVERLKAGYNE